MIDDEQPITNGFLIVKTFENLYRTYAPRYKLNAPYYGLPRLDQGPEQARIRYRGLDRDALDNYDKSSILAEIKMAELEKEGHCSDGFLPDNEALNQTLELLSDKDGYEVIWARIAGLHVPPPEGFQSIGYEASFFGSDHFSASCDCMLFPRWHGTDKEGTLFLEHFQKLNSFGLFKSPEEASTFLAYYLSFDWTETGEYEIAEVFLKVWPGMGS